MFIEHLEIDDHCRFEMQVDHVLTKTKKTRDNVLLQ